MTQPVSVERMWSTVADTVHFKARADELTGASLQLQRGQSDALRPCPIALNGLHLTAEARVGGEQVSVLEGPADSPHGR